MTGAGVWIPAGARALDASPVAQGHVSGHLIRNYWETFTVGAAYYPEWWDPSEWETDFREMGDLGIRAVRMGEFAWAMFEPSPGDFRFDWMDRAIGAANRHNIAAILATPTASVPPWLYQLHPDVLGGNDKGPYTYGGRKGYCTNSPAYLEASARITTALADQYGHHLGVIGWQLDNEPGYPFECFDPNSEKAFQEWLRRRYGTLEALNRAWNGAFWSNLYSDWAQIHFPTNSAEGGWQPAISLDYRRFFSDSFLHHLRVQAGILRVKTRDQFVYTNWPSTTWSVNVFEGAEFLDATAWDNYVSAPGLSDFQHQYIAGINHDIARCAGPHQRFFCAEQVAYVPPNALKDGLRLQAYINLAHGAYGQLYFEWRRPLAGNEQYRPSFIKRFDGAINPDKEIFERIGREFTQLAPQLAGAVTRSDIAFLFDFSNEWTEGFWSLGTSGERYDGQAMRYYTGFKVLQRNIDFCPFGADWSGYKVIVAPGLRLIDNETSERIHRFVADGGIFVLNYRGGTQNMDASMRRAVSPGVFADIAGVAAESYLDLTEYSPAHGSLDEQQRSALGIVFDGSNDVYVPAVIMELLSLHGAELVATFRGGHMDGRPAITRCRSGLGWVYYVATDCEDHRFHEALVRIVASTAKLQPLIEAPYGVEVVSREKAGTTFYFLLNLTEQDHGQVVLPSPMTDLLSGRHGIRQVSLGPLDVAVLASPG
jgi:beta-galactosidase